MVVSRANRTDRTGSKQVGVSRRRFLQQLGLSAAAAGTAVWTGPGILGSTASASPTQVRQGGSLVIAIVSDPSTFNPDLSTYNTNTLEIASSLYDTLVSYNRDWHVIPRLAERWAASGDAKSYVFYLAKNAKWHDGQPVTADDVKWTFETIVSGKGWAADYLRDLDKIETPNPNTVRIDLKRPNAGFLISLAEKGMTILPKHLYQSGDWSSSTYNVTPVGSGPFKFVHYEKGSYVELAANTDYFRGRPYVDRIVFKIVPDPAVTVRAIEAGEVDYSTNFAPFGDIPRLEHDDHVRLLYYTAPVIAWLGFNLTRPPFNDLRVRQAIAYAVDKNELNQKSMDGKAVISTNLYLEGHWATDPAIKLPTYDPNMARQLLKQSSRRSATAVHALVVPGVWGARDH